MESGLATHELGAGWLRDVRDADHRADYINGKWGCQLGTVWFMEELVGLLEE
jgi:hypothetical protein